jgi:hypothetical protein
MGASVKLGEPLGKVPAQSGHTLPSTGDRFSGSWPRAIRTELSLASLRRALAVDRVQVPWRRSRGHHLEMSGTALALSLGGELLGTLGERVAGTAQAPPGGLLISLGPSEPHGLSSGILIAVTRHLNHRNIALRQRLTRTSDGTVSGSGTTSNSQRSPAGVVMMPPR